MKPTFSPRTAVPLGLLGLLILSFGIFIPRLGFYWDDWPVILTGRLQGTAGYWQFYQYDRPVSAWTYVLTFPVLGSTPISWHIFSLLLRWGTAAAFWWALGRLWPGHREEAGWTAFLFAIYPVFLQQPISVAYSQHWTCYLLYALSIAAMIEAWRRRQRHPRLFWLLTGFAMAASLVQLLTMEYFAGLELLRPFLLWILISEQPGRVVKKSLAVLRAWLPYLLVLVGFTVWRLFFLEFPGEEANPPSLLFRMLAEPLDAGLRFLEIALQDTLHLLIGVWAKILDPASVDLLDRFLLFSWVWTIVVAGAAALFLFHLKDDSSHQPELTNTSWARQALMVGIAATALGMLPIWFTDRQIIVGTYSNRFGLPAMLGASLVAVVGIRELIARRVQQIVIISLLIGLAAGLHLRVANDYRWSWVRQTRFYWNLAWRAPNIQPGTAVFAEGEIFKWMGLYSTAAGINLLYPPAQPQDQLPYWFYSLGREFAYDMELFRDGIPLKRDFRHFQFQGNTRDALVIFYKPSESDCLEILTPEDFNIPDLPDVTVEALPNANLARILPELPAPGYPPVEIYGEEPERGWCYLYEKAALAQQMEDWPTAAALGDQAQEEGFSPRASASDTAFEWLPFIEAYARLARWEDAEAISLAAFAEDPRINGRMCDLWEELTLADTVQAGADAAANVRQRIGCP